MDTRYTPGGAIGHICAQIDTLNVSLPPPPDDVALNATTIDRQNHTRFVGLGRRGRRPGGQGVQGVHQGAPMFDHTLLHELCETLKIDLRRGSAELVLAACKTYDRASRR